jgi:hypothetical protein
MILPSTEGPDSQGPLSMTDVERVIERHRDRIVQHPFLKRLQGEGNLEQLRRFLPRHAFFTLAFQDVLRLAVERCTDPQVRTIVHKHELEDKGHDQWYLDDLRLLNIPLDIRWLFSTDHSLARNVGYELVSQILTVKDDHSRLCLVLALEAIGREFFIRIPGFIEGLGVAAELKYFAVRHLGFETSHDVFGDEGKRQLAALKIPSNAVVEVLTVVHRTFEVMTLLADDLEAAMRDAGDLVSRGHQVA